MLRVKIVCTIGPKSHDPEILERLIRAGMNVARLNMSHGTHEYHRATIERIRTISERLQKPVAILADLQGPKLRVGKVQPGGITLKKGDQLVLTVDDIVGVPGRVSIQYKDLPNRVRPGERILLDDGLMDLEGADR
jgi:pyruvate kinase